MKKAFIKMHGLGNDFVIFDGRSDAFALDPAQIRRIADRRLGVGCDQLIVMEPPKNPAADVFMRIHNTDGSEAEACGNATRCVARLVMAEKQRNSIIIETVAGLLVAEDGGERGVCVDMGPVRTEWKDIPLACEVDTRKVPVSEGGLEGPVAINVGNPHAVFFVEDAEKINLENVGPLIENHKIFPAKVNVEVAHVAGKDHLRMRVWERGAGITQACGTGACATAAAAALRGLTGRKVTVTLDGGDLFIEWRESDGHILMTGPAAHAFSGEIEVL